MPSFSDEFVAMYHDKKTTITVPATRDEYWKDEARTIDLVKMDAEGSEPMIVDGLMACVGYLSNRT